MRSLSLTALATCLALSCAAASAATPSALYVFGDSLVDAGNVDAALGNDSFNPVADGYYPGRFTNGPDYTDLLNRRFFGSDLTPSLLGGTDYAFGEAQAVDLPGLPVPALDAQVGSFLADHGGAADPNGLYIINIGGNDVFNLESGDPSAIGGLDPLVYAADVVASITGAVSTLDAEGAHKILVAGIPVIDPTGAALDAALQAGLDALEPSLSAQLYRLDYQTLFPEIVTDPSAFGLPPFTELSTPCLGSAPIVGGVPDCTGYVYFDDTHPTAALQAAVYGAVADILSVPEPRSWALMILGLGVIGARLRRPRAAQAG
jgi:phospholipase/lecithinase/hemolysin